MTPLEESAAREQKRAPLVLCFDDPSEFQSAFQHHIAAGALFVPTSDEYAPGENVAITLDLPFCGGAFQLEGEVVAAVDRSLARTAATTPGVSIRAHRDRVVLKARLENLTGLDLESPVAAAGRERRGGGRARLDADVILTTEDAEYAGTTANICYTGVLVLLPVTSIPVGTLVGVQLSNPLVELDLTLAGKIVHSRRCDGGIHAHGVQLHYPADRIDEVIAFIEFLQRFDATRRHAIIAGEIDEAGLGSILDMFIDTCRSGTLIVKRGKDEGKIVFSENYVLRCTLGMVTGMKALARMFQWRQGRFEFHRELLLAGAQPDPQPVEAAIMMASVQIDEMARIGFDAFAPSDGFELAANGHGPAIDALSELERAVLDHAAEGFSVEAITDMVAAPDSAIYKALATLVDSGLLARSS